MAIATVIPQCTRKLMSWYVLSFVYSANGDFGVLLLDITVAV